MTEKKQDELLGWFKASLSSQRAGLHLLLLRLKGMAVRVGSSLSMNKKFANLMDQIAAEQEKERRIIDKIEALEKHHRKLRKQNLLQRLALEAKLKREA
ncbi:MAG: hypothetical protein PHE27_04915, partial [Alphaproteobacteria bacterium]|nr:hypothetical protein [Alphaproteobacteria bacterium]